MDKNKENNAADTPRLREYLEQKRLLLTRIVDLSRQIEVRSQEENDQTPRAPGLSSADFPAPSGSFAAPSLADGAFTDAATGMDGLLRRRAEYMARCDKVDAALERLLEKTAAPAAQSRLRALLAPGSPPEGETAEERALREQAAACRFLHRQAAALHAESVRTLTARRDALREKLPSPSERRKNAARRESRPF